MRFDELAVHLPPPGVVHRVDHPQEVRDLADPAVLGECLPQPGGTALAAEHPRRITGPDPAGHRTPGERGGVAGRPLPRGLEGSGQVLKEAGSPASPPAVSSASSGGGACS